MGRYVKRLWHFSFKPVAKNVARMAEELEKTGFSAGRLYPRHDVVAWGTRWKNRDVAFYAPISKDGNSFGVVYMKGTATVQVGTFHLTDSGVEVISEVPEFPSLVVKWRAQE